MSGRAMTIVGGGPAGLALGIELRRRGVPVTVREAGQYPRHRVCGEFLRGHGWTVLERLGLVGRLVRAGAPLATSVAFFPAAAEGAVVRRQLPQPALCCSRWTLDAMLAAEFCRLGGELRTGQRCQGGCNGAGIERATGRRPCTEPDGGGWRWFGLKVHARNVALEADLEMHLQPDGYVGLCRVETGNVNVCGLFRRRPGSGPVNAVTWLRGAPGALLEQRLRRAQFVESSLCAVAGLAWHAPGLPWVRRLAESDSAVECCVGDALAVIPPLTGNGLSLALESAAVAAGPLTAWSRGQLSWAEATRAVQEACRAAFARRLTWARSVQRAIFLPGISRLLLWLSGRSNRLWQTLFERTR